MSPNWPQISVTKCPEKVMHNMHTTFSRHFSRCASQKKVSRETCKSPWYAHFTRHFFLVCAPRKKVSSESGVLVRISFTKGLVKLIPLHHHLHHHLHHRGKKKEDIITIIITYILHIVVIILFLHVLLPRYHC